MKTGLSVPKEHEEPCKLKMGVLLCRDDPDPSLHKLSALWQSRLRSPGRFLILGSASIDLLRQSGESLAGRSLISTWGLIGHPVAGASWEGFALENLLAATPERTVASFYRTATGAEIDLLLEIPGHGLWAVEVKRSLSGRPEKGFYIACQDLKPDRRFVVNAGLQQYPSDAETLAIGVPALARMLSLLNPS